MQHLRNMRPNLGRSLATSSLWLGLVSSIGMLPVAAQTVPLFAGNYQDHWTRVAIPPDHPVSNIAQWHVDSAKGQILCDGNGGHEWLRFNQELKNFTFHVKWRFTKLEGKHSYNSGVFFRSNADGSIWYQAQTALDGGYIFGAAPVDGKLTSFNEHKNMTENRIKPPGEWNTYDIRCVNETCTLSVNGAVTSTVHDVVDHGYIGLESEGYRIEFKDLKVRQLP